MTFGMGELQELFGEKRRIIQGWLDRGLLGKPRRTGRKVRLAGREVRRFCLVGREYDLARVNQPFLKAVLFGWGIG